LGGKNSKEKTGFPFFSASRSFCEICMVTTEALGDYGAGGVESQGQIRGLSGSGLGAGQWMSAVSYQPVRSGGRLREAIQKHTTGLLAKITNASPAITLLAIHEDGKRRKRRKRKK
jgi:hypothetical protein